MRSAAYKTYKTDFATYRTSGIVTSTVSHGITPSVSVAHQLLVYWPGQLQSHVNASPLPPCFQNPIRLFFGMLYCTRTWLSHHHRIYHEFFIISEGACKM